MSEVLLYEIWLQATLLVGSWIPMWFLRGQRYRMEKQIWKLTPAAGMYLATVLWIYAGLPPYMKVPLQIIAFAGIGCRIYDLKFRMILVYMVMYIAALYSTELISYLVWDIFDPTPLAIIYGENRAIQHPALQITGFILLFVMVLFIGKAFERERGRIKWKGFFPVIGFTVVVISVSWVITYMVNWEGQDAFGNNRVSRVYLLCALFLLAALIYNICHYSARLRERRRVQEEQGALHEMRLQKNYYEQKLKDEERIREIYHDFKNHLLVLEEQTGNEQEVMVQELREKIAGYEDYRNTGNEFLDIILKEKLAAARRRGIELRVQTEPGAADFMTALDISTIFGGLLDYALEVCDAAAGESSIDLKIQKQNRMQIISIKSSEEIWPPQAVSPEQGRAGEKRTGQDHRVRMIAQRIHSCGGECSSMRDEREYQLSIMIPVTPEKGGGSD